jgi:hypothetical protein
LVLQHAEVHQVRGVDARVGTSEDQTTPEEVGSQRRVLA